VVPGTGRRRTRAVEEGSPPGRNPRGPGGCVSPTGGDLHRMSAPGTLGQGAAPCPPAAGATRPGFLSVLDAVRADCPRRPRACMSRAPLAPGSEGATRVQQFLPKHSPRANLRGRLGRGFKQRTLSDMRSQCPGREILPTSSGKMGARTILQTPSARFEDTELLAKQEDTGPLPTSIGAAALPEPESRTSAFPLSWTHYRSPQAS
jgi:hypothetical protein